MPLEGHVERVHVGRHQVVGERQERTVQRERRVLVERDREDVGLAARAAEERIVEAAWRVVEANFRAPRRRDRRVEVELRVHELVRLAICGAHRGPARARRIPRNTDARPEIVPVGQHPGLRREVLVTGEVQPGRPVREHRAPRAGLEPVQVELIDGAVDQLLREERLPAQAIVQRQARADSPRVLRIQPQRLPFHVEGVRRRLDEAVVGREPADHEVGEAEPGDRAVHRELAGRSHVGRRQRLPAGVAPAEHELMRAAHERQVIADLPGRRVERGQALGAAAELKATRDGQQHVVRHVAVGVDADFRRREEVGARAVDVGVVVGKAERVQRARVDDVVLAERERLRQVVAAADARDEQVLLRRLEAERRRREL